MSLKKNEIIFAEPVLDALKEFEKVLRKFEIGYYFVGAFARDLQYSSKKIDKNYRKTNDIDIAVCLENEDQFYTIVGALAATNLFAQNEKEPIKLIFKSKIEIDLIPFGNIENEAREVILTRPKVFILQMPGFRETHPFIEQIVIGKDTLNLCPLEGLVLLKIISSDDRPERSKDFEDIENIIAVYFDWNSEEIFSEHHDLFDQYDVEDLENYIPMISAHVIGRKIKKILQGSEDLFERITRILKQNDNPRWVAILNGLLSQSKI